MSKRSFPDLVATWVNIFKSIPSEQLEDLTRVEDLWSEPGGQFANPSRSEIKVGSPQESSGGGAERMVRQYSDPAPQMGMTEKYAEFAGMLRDFGKSLIDLHGVAKNQSAQIAALAQMARPVNGVSSKAEGDDSPITKAEVKLRRARAELRKAEMCDDDEREEKKSFLEQATVALKSAKRALTKAEDEEMKEEEEDRAEKARSDFHKLSKAVRKAEDEDAKKEEEDETKKAVAAKAIADAEAAKKAAETAAAEAAAKAATEAAAKAAADAAAKAEHGGEATEDKDEDEKTEKARAATEAAAKAAETAKGATVDPSLRNEITLLNTTVKGLFDVVMSGSKSGPLPSFAKSAPLPALVTKVDTAIEDGTLENANEIMKAHTLVTHIRAVQDGKMDAAIVEDEIARAPDNVRQLFQPALAA